MNIFKKYKLNTILIVFYAIMLALIIAIGTTIAIFNSDSTTDSGTNVGNISAKLYKGTTADTPATTASPIYFTSGWGTEVYGSSVSEASVWIKNTSTIPIVLRLSIAYEWYSVAGSTWTKITTSAGSAALLGIDLRMSANWTLAETHYWHYNNVIKPTDTTPISVFNSIRLPNAKPAAATHLKLTFTVEGMQQEFSTINTGFIGGWSPGGISTSSGFNTGPSYTADGTQLVSGNAVAGFLYYLAPIASGTGWASVGSVANPTPTNSLMTGAYDSSMGKTDYTLGLLNNGTGGMLRVYNNARVSVILTAVISVSWYRYTGSQYVLDNNAALNTNDISITFADAHNSSTNNTGSWLTIDESQQSYPNTFQGGSNTKFFAYSQPVDPLSAVDIIGKNITIATEGVSDSRYLRVTVQVTGVERSQMSFDQVRKTSGYFQLDSFSDFSSTAYATLKTNLESPYRRWLETVGGLVKITITWATAGNIALPGYNPSNLSTADGYNSVYFYVKKGEVFVRPSYVLINGSVSSLAGYNWRISSSTGALLAMNGDQSAQGMLEDTVLYLTSS